MLIIADGNNLAWAGFHALRKPMGAETPEQFVRAALLGLMQTFVGLVVRGGEPPADLALGRGAPVPQDVAALAIAFDEGRPLRRRALFPQYQLGRESNPAFMENEAFVLDGIAQFIEAAATLPVTILRGVNTEADDLVAALVLRDVETPVRIASTDRDFLQLVDDRVSIYSPVKRLVIDTSNFAEATAPKTSDGMPVNFPRERYLDYRVAAGDASDDLPGIPGVGTLTAARLLARAPLDEYLRSPGLASTALGRQNKKVEAAFWSGEARAVVDRNRQLMDLRLGAAHYPTLDGVTTVGAWDEPGFRAWVAEQRISGLELEAAVRALSGIANHR